MRLILTLFVLALLSACGPKADLPFPTDDGAAPSADSPGMPVEPDGTQQETGNVSYRGVVEPPGISLYMQGTHRLALEDDRFILLEGPAVDLNAYLGEEVEVFGAARPTVEGGGVIMRVERVTRTVARSEASSFSSALPPFSSSSLPSSSSLSSTAPLADISSRAVVSSASPSSIGGSLGQDASVTMMTKEKFSKEQWTQEYCSTHAGFCVPIHRNWWFKSFGTTSSSLWHVEVNGAPVENLGDGVLLVNMIHGDIATSGAADREVRMHGNFAVGYRRFSDNRHFEISAPGELKEAVQYMTENLR